MRSLLVTGAARGFGRALVDACLLDGWRVFALVRRRADAESLAASGAERLVAFTADVCEADVGECPLHTSMVPRGAPPRHVGS